MNDTNNLAKGLYKLNELFKTDKNAIWTLLNASCYCSESLADHPGIKAIEKDKNGETVYQVSVFSLLNAILSSYGDIELVPMISMPDNSGKRHLLGFDLSFNAEPRPALIAD